jgi:hypothetical protein
MYRRFPPHRIIGNVYYVGTESLASFLITTPEGHILINSNYEANVPIIQQSQRPTIIGEYTQAYERLRPLPVDVPLGSHPSMYRMAERYARIGGDTNPFIDPEGFIEELDLNESIFRQRLEEQGASR